MPLAMYMIGGTEYSLHCFIINVRDADKKDVRLTTLYLEMSLEEVVRNIIHVEAISVTIVRIS